MAQSVALYREIEQVLMPSGSSVSLKATVCIMAGFIELLFYIQDGIDISHCYQV